MSKVCICAHFYSWFVKQYIVIRQIFFGLDYHLLNIHKNVCSRHRIQSKLHNQIFIHRLLDSLVVECWFRVREVPDSISSQGPPPRQPSGRVLASGAGGPGFNPQSRTASYQRRYKNGNSSSLVWYSTLKGKYWLFLKN